ncbi:MAG: SDR family oxidoreductase [Sphingomonadales bacterium]|nr:SDR family oxidoreductase [Sphingomonadales bacterium]
MSKTIAITGAGDGLGRALARRFAREGHRIVLINRTLAKAEAVAAELGEPHFAVQADVGDPESVRAAFAEIGRRVPKLDVLINNAGIFQPFRLDKAEDDLVQRMIATNLTGTIWVSREAVPLLKADDSHPGGLIVNVTSESSHIKMPRLWLYAATKVAVEYMGEEWAKELAADKIRVTTVRAGQMMDETKTGSTWPIEDAMEFMQENLKVGIDMRARGISHYNSAADAIAAVVNLPADIHMNYVGLNSRAY